MGVGVIQTRNTKKQDLEALGERWEEIRTETQDSKEPQAALGRKRRGQVGIQPSLPAPPSGKQPGTPAGPLSRKGN